MDRAAEVAVEERLRLNADGATTEGLAGCSSERPGRRLADGRRCQRLAGRGALLALLVGGLLAASALLAAGAGRRVARGGASLFSAAPAREDVLLAASARISAAVSLRAEAADAEENVSIHGEAEDAEVQVPSEGSGFPHKAFEPSLFCFSVMQPNGTEEELVKNQLKHRRSIFACDDFAVLSPARRFLGYGHRMSNGSWVEVYSWYNPVPKAKFGNIASGDRTASFKNTAAFIEAWDTLSKSRVLEGHAWVAKVDPDAVFFAYRLRRHVARLPVRHTPLYLKNCKRKPGWTNDYLFGALEVFNAAAVSAYAQRGDSCKSLPAGGWGEDMWISKCMESLGAQARLETELVSDKRCVYKPCSDVWSAAFHDYKAVGAWNDCWRRSARSEAYLGEAKRTGKFCCDGKDPCGKCNTRKYPGEDECTTDANCGRCGVRPGGCGR
mmetsp:Transcript_103268/g.321823  ORF Transcript_103268/g.321823 Transcript_103268/m.321823 type:complete len:440 (-) Transcript_103268:42-1361(-)